MAWADESLGWIRHAERIREIDELRTVRAATMAARGRDWGLRRRVAFALLRLGEWLAPAPTKTTETT